MVRYWCYDSDFANSLRNTSVDGLPDGRLLEALLCCQSRNEHKCA